VIESTGVFREAEEARKHVRGTVKKVIISAPPKANRVPMYVMGVNEDKMGKESVFSCASCTTNCVAPIIKVMDRNFGISKGWMSTIHAYTADQELLDGSHQDWRRGRAAAVNIVPTTTGAARATGKVYPAVKNIFDGLAVRVPVITGSLTDFTLVTKKKTTSEKINQVLEEASKKELKGILGVTREPLVSSDIIGSEFSALVDLSLTRVIKGDLVKVIAWYDNEWGYSQRLIEEVLLVANKCL
jgi:glyceraldehyde-3-phosphate dehydrogenase type I